MCLVNTIRWIKPKFYNPLRHVQKAKNLVVKEEQKFKIKELRELIPEISQVGIEVLNRDWHFEKNENSNSQVKGFAIYSKSDYERGDSEVICTTACTSIKKSSCAIKDIIKPSSRVSEITDKIE